MTLAVIKYFVRDSRQSIIGHVYETPGKGGYSSCLASSTSFGPFMTKDEAIADVNESHREELARRVRRFDRLTLVKA